MKMTYWRLIRNELDLEIQRAHALRRRAKIKGVLDPEWVEVEAFWRDFSTLLAALRPRLAHYAHSHLDPLGMLRALGLPMPREDRTPYYWEFIPEKIRSAFEVEHARVHATRHWNIRNLFRDEKGTLRDTKDRRFSRWKRMLASLEEDRLRYLTRANDYSTAENYRIYNRAQYEVAEKVKDYLEKTTGQSLLSLRAFLAKTFDGTKHVPTEWRVFISEAGAAHLLPDDALILATPEQRDADAPLIVDTAAPPQFESLAYISSLSATKKARASTEPPKPRGRPKGKRDSYQRKRTSKYDLEAYREKWK